MAGFDFSKARAAARVNAEKKAAFAERGNHLNFKVEEDGSEVVRFLDLASAFAHRVQVAGQQYPEFVISQDQSPYPGPDSSCPLVQNGSFKRTFRGWVTLIWRDAPEIKREAGQDGKPGKAVKDAQGNYIVIGKRDQIAVWKTGTLVFEQLDELDGTYRGLGSRDFRVKRKGAGLDTRYTIQPADPDGGQQPLSESDLVLVKDLPDLKAMTKPRSVEAIRAFINGDSSALNEAPQGSADADDRVEDAVAKNPWA